MRGASNLDRRDFRGGGFRTPYRASNSEHGPCIFRQGKYIHKVVVVMIILLLYHRVFDLRISALAKTCYNCAPNLTLVSVAFALGLVPDLVRIYDYGAWLLCVLQCGVWESR